MKKILLLIFILITNFFFSQKGIRLLYQYTYNIDSLNKNNIEKTLYFLDLHNDFSVFQKSEISSMKTEEDFSFSGNLIGNKIIRHYTSAFTNQYLYFSPDYFCIKNDKSFNWKILSDKGENILGYDTSKATVEAFGRKWTAWFTNEIPIQSGPYKFYGLPGLILKIVDNTNSHIFTAISLEKINLANVELEQDKKCINISSNEFKKIYLQKINNPIKNIINSEITKTEDGISGAELKRRMQESLNRQFRKNNNLLELDLLHAH